MNAKDILALPWIKAIQPIRDPHRRRLSEHSELEVWHVDIELPRWPIPPDLDAKWAADDEANISATWRKRPLVQSRDAGCPYYCGEVELALRLRRAGFRSQWVSEWSGFPHVKLWKDICIKRSELKDRSPRVAAFDDQLRRRTPVHTALGKSGGHPDVVAWEDGSEEFVFLEYKGPGDKIKLTQDLWAKSVLAQVVDRLPYVAVIGTFVG